MSDVQKFLERLPGFVWSKYPGEKHLPNYQYCGPSTRLDIRLDENGMPKHGEEPINRVDKTCYNHDVAYKNAGDNLSNKHDADRIMLEQLNSIQNPSIRERIDRLIIKGLIGTKLKLGMSIETEKLANELHHEYRRPPVYLKVKVFSKDEIWSADLVEMPKENAGRLGTYKYILTVIDLYTRYGFAIPLKSKTALEVKTAFESIFKSNNRKPKRLWTDRGKEFYNKLFQSFLKDNNIKLYSTYNEGKAVVVERFNRTLKQYMWKKFTEQGTQKWFKMLPSVLNYYNNKIHSSIKTTPIEASEHPEKIKELIANNNYENENTMSKRQNKPKFKVGDRVRIYRYKLHFEHGFTHKYTEEIFKISKVLLTSPVTYELVDLHGEPIQGRFYTGELIKTEF
jgi:hypothetical protein